MKNKPKFYRFCLHKAYFDKGYGLTTYPKWALAVVGVASSLRGTALIWIITGGLLYGLSCYIIGRIWYKSGLTLAEFEVANQFNLFQKQIRNKFKIEKFK